MILTAIIIECVLDDICGSLPASQVAVGRGNVLFELKWPVAQDQK